jgi:hypothetical protein
MSLLFLSISAFAVTMMSDPLGGGALGLADELGLTDELGETDALADDEADGERLTLLDGLSDGLTLGLTDADGDALGEPITATAISAHTFTPLVASRSENVWTQNSYGPTARAGHVNVASLLASGASLSGESVCTPPGSVTQMRAYCPPGA